MNPYRKRQATVGVLMGMAFVGVGITLAVLDSKPAFIAIFLLGGSLIYLSSCAILAKAKGYNAARGILVGLVFPVLLVLAMPDRSRMSKGKREREDAEEDAAEEAYRTERRRPLEPGKKVIAWLVGLGLVILGIAIVVGYQIYWTRVVVSQRESLAGAVSVSAGTVDPHNDGKLIHVVGELSGAQKLTDPEFGVALNALRLRRRVWMYQWQQGKLNGQSSYGTVDSNGKNTTYVKTRTYDYSKDWFEKVINSRAFYNSGHANPVDKKIPDRAVVATKISLGEYTIAPQLAEQIDNFQTVPVSDKNISSMTEPFRRRAKLEDNSIYVATNYRQPEIGDLKIKFESAPQATVSIIARQNGTSLSPNAGSIALLRFGTYSVREMVAQFAEDNSHARMIVWIIGGVLVLFGGLIIRMALK